MDKNEAIKIIRSNFPTGRHQLCEALETLIPELKESDDEQIKNEIIDYLKGFIPHHNDDLVAKSKLWIAWLEKQGEQKPADKVEPKFKVGDWITIDNPCQIISIDGNYIVQYCDDEKTHEISKKFCEFQFHLWIIQDAKSGDVLYYKSLRSGVEFIVMSRGINGYGNIDSYFRYNSECGFINVPSVLSADSGYITPATKEQRDLLFSKMKEAGYEWDAEKKELKKMKQKTTKLPKGEDYGIDSLYHAARILEKTLGEVEGYQSDDGILEHKCAIEAVKRLYEHKSIDMEKACEWLKTNAGKYAFVDTDRIGNVADIDLSLVQDFRNYMKGE